MNVVVMFLKKEGKGVPVVGSSCPVSLFFSGQSTFSAPSYLRIFFHRTLESIAGGRPEMMMVRMAKGSCGTCGRGGGLDFGSFFTVAASPISRGSLGCMM